MAEKEEMLAVASSPFIHSNNNITKVLLDVLIALVPAMAAAVYFFGLDALVLMAVSVSSCVFFELFWQKALKQPVRIKDLSAVLTGLLLSLTLSPSVPWWIVVSGAFVSIIFGKQVFGGFAHNPFNPALAGRIFLQLSWPQAMNACMGPVDGITAANPIAASLIHTLPSRLHLLIGYAAGSIGNVSALALILGGIYLIKRRQIFAITPVTFVATVAVGAYVLGENMILQVFTGGLILCAFFMATDPVTSPWSNFGRFVFAFGCGLIALLIRVEGGRPEGVYYSILLMNMTVPLIDKFTIPKPFGYGGTAG
jgi:electron transport complex protein RnfD